MPEPIQIDSLFRNGSIHRSVYSDRDLFEAERRLIFGRAWLYAGHASQLKKPGDFLTTEIAGQPVLVLKGGDGTIRGFFNRCPHRGAVLARAECGHVEKIQCSYHGWSFTNDGALDAIPAGAGYQGTEVAACPGDYALMPVPRFASYRGFLFASLAAEGPDLKSFLGPLSGTLDNMNERAPAGEVEIAGGTFRMLQRSNWKIYLENLHDGAHAMVTHESSIAPAQHLFDAATAPWEKFAAQVVMANAQPARAMAALSVQCYADGHSEMTGFRKTRPPTPEQAEYEALLAARVGKAGVEEILGIERHNIIIYPGFAIQPNHMQLRVITPLAVDLTQIDVHTLKLVGAPDAINRRIIAYANVIHSPASLVRADDLENFERVQQGYRAEASPWVSAHRELANDVEPSSPMSERFIRNQFAAWRSYMGRSYMEGRDA